MFFCKKLLAFTLVSFSLCSYATFLDEIDEHWAKDICLSLSNKEVNAVFRCNTISSRDINLDLNFTKTGSHGTFEINDNTLHFSLDISDNCEISITLINQLASMPRVFVIGNKSDSKLLKDLASCEGVIKAISRDLDGNEAYILSDFTTSSSKSA